MLVLVVAFVSSLTYEINDKTLIINDENGGPITSDFFNSELLSENISKLKFQNITGIDNSTLCTKCEKIEELELSPLNSNWIVPNSFIKIFPSIKIWNCSAILKFEDSAFSNLPIQEFNQEVSNFTSNMFYNTPNLKKVSKSNRTLVFCTKSFFRSGIEFIDVGQSSVQSKAFCECNSLTTIRTNCSFKGDEISSCSKFKTFVIDKFANITTNQLSNLIFDFTHISTVEPHFGEDKRIIGTAIFGSCNVHVYFFNNNYLHTIIFAGKFSYNYNRPVSLDFPRTVKKIIYDGAQLDSLLYIDNILNENYTVIIYSGVFSAFKYGPNNAVALEIHEKIKSSYDITNRFRKLKELTINGDIEFSKLSGGLPNNLQKLKIIGSPYWLDSKYYSSSVYLYPKEPIAISDPLTVNTSTLILGSNITEIKDGALSQCVIDSLDIQCPTVVLGEKMFGKSIKLDMFCFNKEVISSNIAEISIFKRLNFGPNVKKVSNFVSYNDLMVTIEGETIIGKDSFGSGASVYFITPKIPSHAFTDFNHPIKSISFKNTKEICDEAFFNYKLPENDVFEFNLAIKIGSKAFAGSNHKSRTVIINSEITCQPDTFGDCIIHNLTVKRKTILRNQLWFKNVYYRVLDQKLEQSQFRGCKNMETFEGAGSLSLGSYCFADNPKLKELKIFNINSLGSCVFSGSSPRYIKADGNIDVSPDCFDGSSIDTFDLDVSNKYQTKYKSLLLCTQFPHNFIIHMSPQMPIVAFKGGKFNNVIISIEVRSMMISNNCFENAIMKKVSFTGYKSFSLSSDAFRNSTFEYMNLSFNSIDWGCFYNATIGTIILRGFSIASNAFKKTKINKLIIDAGCGFSGSSFRDSDIGEIFLFGSQCSDSLFKDLLYHLPEGYQNVYINDTLIIDTPYAFKGTKIGKLNFIGDVSIQAGPYSFADFGMLSNTFEEIFSYISVLSQNSFGDYPLPEVLVFKRHITLNENAFAGTNVKVVNATNGTLFWSNTFNGSSVHYFRISGASEIFFSSNYKFINITIDVNVKDIYIQGLSKIKGIHWAYRHNGTIDPLPNISFESISFVGPPIKVIPDYCFSDFPIPFLNGIDLSHVERIGRYAFKDAKEDGIIEIGSKDVESTYLEADAFYNHNFSWVKFKSRRLVLEEPLSFTVTNLSITRSIAQNLDIDLRTSFPYFLEISYIEGDYDLTEFLKSETDFIGVIYFENPDNKIFNFSYASLAFNVIFSHPIYEIPSDIITNRNIYMDSLMYIIQNAEIYHSRAITSVLFSDEYPIVLSPNIKRIDADAFELVSASSISIPHYTEGIDKNAFRGMLVTNFTIVIEDNKDGSRKASSKMPPLSIIPETNLLIVNNSDNIPTGAFMNYNTYNFSSFILSPIPTKIPDRCFYLETKNWVVFPNFEEIMSKAEEIGEEAFTNCTLPGEITLPKTLRKIGNNALSYTGVTKVNIEFEKLESYPKEMFGNDQLVKIYVAEGANYKGPSKLFGIKIENYQGGGDEDDNDNSNQGGTGTKTTTIAISVVAIIVILGAMCALAVYYMWNKKRRTNEINEVESGSEEEGNTKETPEGLDPAIEMA